jgi:hypothetical protein
MFQIAVLSPPESERPRQSKKTKRTSKPYSIPFLLLNQKLEKCLPERVPYCGLPAASAPPPPPPTFQGDRVIACDPLGVAAKMGSTPESIVTAVTLLLPGEGSEATIIKASPGLRSVRDSVGSLDSI